MTNHKVAVTQQENNAALMRHPEFAGRTITPVADIYETEDAYVVALDMPGTSKESISISFEQGSLVVKGSTQPYHKPEAAILFRELSNANYHRVFNLGEGIDRTNADAQFSEGVLTVKLFKKEEMKPREIRIN